jgi:transcriptional regulator with XRE-family HTH domain
MNVKKDEVILVSSISLGMKAKIARISQGWRQVDLASAARVNIRDISNLEADRWNIVYKSKVRRMLTALGIEVPPEFAPDDMPDDEGDTFSD